MTTANTLRCQRCGHEWAPLVGRPKVCPRCKSYEWDKPYKREPRRQPAGEERE